MSLQAPIVPDPSRTIVSCDYAAGCRHHLRWGPHAAASAGSQTQGETFITPFPLQSQQDAV